MNVRLEMLVATAACVLCTACAPKFIDVPSPRLTAVWVERDATVIHDSIATMEQREVVQINTAKDAALNAGDRVIWVSGVDVANGKLQRTHERIGGKQDASANAEFSGSDKTVTVHQFEIHGDALSAAGQLAYERFKAQSNDRYYVEFLNKGQMTAEGVEQTMAAWKQISAKLKTRGLNTSNVILGGSKFEQKMNAIVLVKVGK